MLHVVASSALQFGITAYSGTRTYQRVVRLNGYNKWDFWQEPYGPPQQRAPENA